MSHSMGSSPFWDMRVRSVFPELEGAELRTFRIAVETESRSRLSLFF